MPPSPCDVMARLGDKITSPEDATACVSFGSKVFVGTACATPRVLVQALENTSRELRDVNYYHFLVDGIIPSKGLRGFTADILVRNKAMLTLAKKCCSHVKIIASGSTYEVEMLF